MRIKAVDSTIKLYGMIWDGDGSYITGQIESYNAAIKTTMVHLNTKGGDVFDGNDIYRSLLRVDTDITVDGLAASMGSILMLAGRKVYMTKSSLVMIHAPSGGVRGTAKEVKKAAELLEKLESDFLRKYSAKTGKPQKDLKYLLEGDNWLTADECLALGLIDGIVDDVFKPEEINALKSMKVAAVVKEDDPFEMSLNDVQPPKIETKPKNENKLEINNSTMKKELIAAFAFFASANVTEASSDTAMITAMSNHITDLEGKVTAAEAKVKTLEDANTEASKKAITNAVATAIKDGKIKAEQEGTFIQIGESSGIESLNAAFDAMGTRTTISSTINEITSALKGKSWDELQKEDPRALEVMKKDNPDAFNALFKAKFGTEYKD